MVVTAAFQFKLFGFFHFFSFYINDHFIRLEFKQRGNLNNQVFIVDVVLTISSTQTLSDSPSADDILNHYGKVKNGHNEQFIHLPQ